MPNPWERDWSAGTAVADPSATPAAKPWERDWSGGDAISKAAPSIPGMEKLGGVAPAMPPRPRMTAPPSLNPLNAGVRDLEEPAPEDASKLAYRNPRTGRGYSQQDANARVPILDAPREGAAQIAEGAYQTAQPGMRNKAGGVHQMIGGAMKVAEPAAAVAGAVAPLRTAVALGTGMVAGGATTGAAKAVGVPDEYADLAGDAAGIAAGAKAAKANIGGRTVAAVKAPFDADPQVAMVKAMKPRATDAGFDGRIKENLANIKAAVPGGNIAENEVVMQATKQAIASHEAALETEFMAPARQAGTQIPGDAIAKATEMSLPETMKMEDPAMANRITLQAQKAYSGKTFTVDKMYRLLKEKNAELKSFYDQAQGNQQAAVVSGAPEAVIKAQRDTIASALYRALDPHGDGAGPREIQSQIGDMIDIQEAAQRRKYAILAEKPVSKAGGIGKTLAGVANVPGKLLHGDVEGAIEGVTKARSGVSDPLIKRAFEAVGPPKPLPKRTPAPVPLPGPNAGPPPGPKLPRSMQGQSDDALLSQYAIETNPAKLADLQARAASRGLQLPERPVAASPAARSAALLKETPDYAGMFEEAKARDAKLSEQEKSRRAEDARAAAIPALAAVEANPEKAALLKLEAQRRGLPPPPGPVPVSPAQRSAEAFSNAPDYAGMFDAAAKREVRAARTPPQVPETGVPENVARTVANRDRIALQTTGKRFEELNNSERLIVDDLINEGMTGAGAGGPMQPPPRPKR